MAGWGGLPPCSLPNLKAHIANRTGEEGEDCGDVISVSSYSYSHCKFILETLINHILTSYCKPHRGRGGGMW